MSHCERCFKKTAVVIMSMFNTEMICLECQAEEKKHPDYQIARDIEHQHVVDGNYNFPGIGKPDDL